MAAAAEAMWRDAATRQRPHSQRPGLVSETASGYLKQQQLQAPNLGDGGSDRDSDGGSGGGVVAPELGLVVDSSLSVLARKLRMVGVDTRVAGEVIKGQQPAGGEGQGSPALSPAAAAEAAAANGGGAEAVRGGGRSAARRNVGLLRVGIVPSLFDEHMRSAALEGRLIVMNAGAKRAAGALPGAAYRLLATDASAQFAELLAVLELSGLVDAGGSRCGICNGDEWQTLRPDEVEAGQVPHAVLRVQPVFYRCGACMQMFWPGDKYESTMDGLRAEGRDVPPRRAGTAGVAWRPPVPSAPARPPTEDRRRPPKTGTLHSTMRMKFSLDE